MALLLNWVGNPLPLPLGLIEKTGETMVLEQGWMRCVVLWKVVFGAQLLRVLYRCSMKNLIRSQLSGF
uniref:Uncharacterized protein n=1 Tax=Rhizophora mucronata TaxID=61149 RepID=A0A2P2KGQ9_RHIMU